MKAVFTIGQIAKLCQVASRTATNWFDSGLLKGYRLPGSGRRIVTRENLSKFLSEQGLPFVLPD